MVRSILEYGSIVWDPYLQRDVQRIEKVQRRAARFIVSDYKTQSQGFMTQTLKELGLPPLQQRRIYNRLAFFHKSANGLVPAIQADTYLRSIENKRRIKRKNLSGYISKNLVASRNNSKCYVNIQAKCEQYKNSFFPRSINDWNALDNNIVNEVKNEPFKTILKRHMFD